MSVEVMTIVWKADIPAASKFLLLAMADTASDDGSESYQSVKTLAVKVCKSTRSVQRSLRDLEQAGFIRASGQSRFGTIIYDLNLPKIRLLGGGDKMSGGRHSVQGGGDTGVAGGGDVGVTQTTQEQPSKEQPPPPQSPPKRWQVDRKPVTDDESALADAVLAAFNHAAGTNYRARDHLAKIIMRAREHPDLALPEHEHIIVAAFQQPWWKGTATPNVIYGNAGLFERHIESARHGPPVSRRAAQMHRLLRSVS